MENNKNKPSMLKTILVLAGIMLIGYGVGALVLWLNNQSKESTPTEAAHEQEVTEEESADNIKFDKTKIRIKLPPIRIGKI